MNDTYSFRRAALNASYSNRTAQAGKPFRGSLSAAVEVAKRYSEKNGMTVTIHDSDGRNLAVVTHFRYQGSDELWVNIQIREELIPHLVSKEY